MSFSSEVKDVRLICKSTALEPVFKVGAVRVLSFPSRQIEEDCGLSPPQTVSNCPPHSQNILKRLILTPSSIAVLLFSVAAIELKRKAPYAQTFLQIAKHRYGAPAHIVLASYSLLYQVITTVSLLVGGSAVFSILTGVNRDALCFLFPVGVVSFDSDVNI